MTFIENLADFAIGHPLAFAILGALLVFGWNFLSSFVTSGFSWIGGLAGGTTKTVQQTVATGEEAAKGVYAITHWVVDNEPALMTDVIAMRDKITAAIAAKATPPAPAPTTTS